MKREKIYSVEKVKVVLLKRNPPILNITALGQVNSGGWTNPQLGMHQYVMSPADGIQAFDFTAESPNGPVIEVITPISATFDLESPPSWLKGVRVHALSNYKEAFLSQGK